MNRTPRPPRLAGRVLTLALPEDSREHITDELTEVFQRLCEGRGPARARPDGSSRLV